MFRDCSTAYPSILAGQMVAWSTVSNASSMERGPRPGLPGPGLAPIRVAGGASQRWLADVVVAAAFGHDLAGGAASAQHVAAVVVAAAFSHDLA
jgi:hypothetical protein